MPRSAPRRVSSLPYRLGVGIMLFDKDGRVFVARRIDAKADAWQMPQGGIDGEEAPRAAALRELEEEIGTANAMILAESKDWHAYDLPPHLIGRVWGGRFRGQRQKWFAARFMGKDAEIDLHTKHPEFDAWQWVDVERLTGLIVPFKRKLYTALVGEFGHLARPKAR
jgi:putative (di)nucleoside polyphosphate hydrolase